MSEKKVGMQKSDLIQAYTLHSKENLRRGRALEYVIQLTSGTTSESRDFLIRYYKSGYHPPKAPRALYIFTSPMAQVNFGVQSLIRGFAHTVLILGVEELRRQSRLIAEYEPDTLIVGSMNSMVTLAQCEDLAEVCLKVCTIALVGELPTEMTAHLMREKYPRAVLRSAYGMAELGAMGAPCKHLGYNRYHPWQDTRFKILSPDESGVGDVVVSKTIAPSFKIENYMTGDSGRLLTEDCPCGHKEVLEVLGRNGYDFIRVGPFALQRNFFERMAVQLRAQYSDYQATYDRSSRILQVRVIPTPELLLRANAVQFLEKIITETLELFPNSTLQEAVEQNLISAVRVEFARSFPSGPKAVKLKSIK